MRAILLTTLAFCAVAGVAAAQPPQTDGEAVTRARLALDAAVRNSTPAKPALSYARFAQSRVPGVAQTSIETRFSKRDDASAEAGLLCGLLPHPDRAGAAAAFGHDPDGKFVGTKVKLSF